MTISRHTGVAWLLAAACVLGPGAAGAQDKPAAPPADAAAPGSDDLAKKLANPISDLVSVPFQFNWAPGVGPEEDTRFILNVQPVMPFPITNDWNMIARVIVPFIGQPPLFPGGAPASGMSDILASFFFSPKVSPVVWGVGPVIGLPSTNEPVLGTQKWTAGPTAVVLKQSGQWTVGVLWNQVWSFAGNERRDDVSRMYVQPFASYTTRNQVTLSIASEASADWKADEDQWTVPILGAVSKLSSFGMFPASYQFAAGVYVAGPENGPDWLLRAGITVLMPRRR